METYSTSWNTNDKPLTYKFIITQDPLNIDITASIDYGI